MKIASLAVLILAACQPARAPGNDDPLEARRVQFETALGAARDPHDLAQQAEVAKAASAYLFQANFSLQDRARHQALAIETLTRILPTLQELLGADVACTYRKSAVHVYTSAQAAALLVPVVRLTHDCIDAAQLDEISVHLKAVEGGCTIVTEVAPEVWGRTSVAFERDGIFRAVERCSTPETLARNLSLLPPDAIRQFRQGKVIRAQQNLEELVDASRSRCQSACLDLYNDEICSRRCDRDLDCRRACSAAGERCARTCQ